VNALSPQRRNNRNTRARHRHSSHVTVSTCRAPSPLRTCNRGGQTAGSSGIRWHSGSCWPSCSEFRRRWRGRL